MNRRAVEKILKLKGRSASKGLILITANRHQLRPYATRSSIEAAWGKGLWPVPVTWVLPGKIGLRKQPSALIDFASENILRP